ncbi:MAG TPA: HAMP domain-containing sensor histidine kinase [Anaerolineales bacterium]|nr:HAMP domain-containing sensor histidine kinase [Anaerolineales bacterium]
MNKKSWIPAVLILLPLLIGALISFLAQRIWNPVPLMVFKIDAGMVAFVTGVVITLLFGVAYLNGWIKEQRAEKRIEQSLQESEQGRQRFIRRLDHEIKNPLTALRAALVNLQESQDSAERQMASENAHRAVERLTRLLNDLRKLSDLEERSIERMPVDIPELLDDVVDAARTIPAYRGRNVSLFISKVPAPLPPVRGDRDLLSLAVYNLVENALKYSSQNDSVEVRALEDGKAVVVEVADSGGGIASEDLSKIFEELYRGSNARSTEGSGLGLALVNRIISLHGGQIDVRSRQNGPRGTVFTVRLPESKS